MTTHVGKYTTTEWVFPKTDDSKQERWIRFVNLIISVWKNIVVGKFSFREYFSDSTKSTDLYLNSLMNLTRYHLFLNDKTQTYNFLT